MMQRLVLATLGLGVLNACVTTNACDNYVDYLCECHADDPDYDCNELRIIYQDASGEDLSDCSVALDEQQDEDEATGEGCATGGTGI
jgi:hypothetical protein